MGKIKGVERELGIARRAVGDLLARIRRDAGVLDPAHRPRDAASCLANLDATYMIRMFAVFEEGLRLVWDSVFGRRSQPPVSHLLKACAARLNMPTGVYRAADAARDHRNALVHGGPGRALTAAEMRSRLCRFFSYMPRNELR